MTPTGAKDPKGGGHVRGGFLRDTSETSPPSSSPSGYYIVITEGRGGKIEGLFPPPQIVRGKFHSKKHLVCKIEGNTTAFLFFWAKKNIKFMTE